MHRRPLLKVLLCCAFTPATAWCQQPPAQWEALELQSLGCSIDERQAAVLSNRAGNFAALTDKLIDSTGDEQMDAALGRALVRLAAAFGQRPGFGFFDDAKGKNAYASRTSVVPGTWGTVFYGKRMFQEIMEKADDAGMAALTIAAHEFAHIAQFRAKADRKLMEDQTTVKRVELHADFLAGWYLGTRKSQQPDLKLWAAGRTIYEIGDEEFNDPQHHGTPEQRVHASEQGYALGLESVDFQEAFERGMTYVLERYP